MKKKRFPRLKGEAAKAAGKFGKEAAQREYARRHHEKCAPGYRAQSPESPPPRYGGIIEAVLRWFNGG